MPTSVAIAAGDSAKALAVLEDWIKEFNQALEHAGRVADFLEFAELMCLDALDRKESCGGHFRLESQTKEGEALRDDEHYCHVSAWEYAGPEARSNLIKEPLGFEYVKLSQRSYK